MIGPEGLHSAWAEWLGCIRLLILCDVSTAMSSIHIKHRHSLKHGETRERVDRIANHLKSKYKVNYTWDGDQLRSKHKGSYVHVYLADGCIEMKIQLGMLFAPLKGRIERAIRKNLHSVIGDEDGAPSKITLHEKL
jgi:putative polyhydroxyalkanoate system protein